VFSPSLTKLLRTEHSHSTCHTSSPAPSTVAVEEYCWDRQAASGHDVKEDTRPERTWDICRRGRAYERFVQLKAHDAR
jgi:hypothetical protein